MADVIDIEEFIEPDPRRRAGNAKRAQASRERGDAEMQARIAAVAAKARGQHVDPQVRTRKATSEELERIFGSPSAPPDGDGAVCDRERRAIDTAQREARQRRVAAEERRKLEPALAQEGSDSIEPKPESKATPNPPKPVKAPLEWKVERTCERAGCEHTYIPNANMQKYCGITCSERVAAARRRARAGGRTMDQPRTCLFCECSFKPRAPRQEYCSEVCRNEAARQQTLDSSRRKRGKDPLARYIDMLMKLARQPDCPAHVFDRLERLVGAHPEEEPDA